MRMRVVELGTGADPEHRERFDLLYQGFLTGGNGPGAKGIEDRRREASILKKMESVSYEIEGSKCESCGNVTPSKRILNEGEQRIELTVPEHEILRKYVEATPWTVRMSGKVCDIIDWLASLPTVQS